ncbi:peroxidase 11 [Capsicum chacoense]
MASINFFQSRIMIFKFLIFVFICNCLSKLINGISDSHLSLDYYKKTCPSVEGIVRKEMECACLSDPRNAALILRLHFHDCFVQGCDGSVLLDDTVTLKGEKNAPNNKNALKGFRIIDKIKNSIESECPGIVSCADILTIAARDAVLLVGGPYWDVPLGRKDSINAAYELTDTNLPTADEGLISIISKFISQGLSVTDMVALSGAHTIGKARCVNFRKRIYGDFKMTSTSMISPISSSYLSELKSLCPPIDQINGSSDNNETSMDNITPDLFDNSYYHVLLKGEGLINSDQELYSSFLGIQTKKIVEKYAANTIAFFEQFAQSMVKMGNITNPETYVNGEIRKSCRFVNT